MLEQIRLALDITRYDLGVWAVAYAAAGCVVVLLVVAVLAQREKRASREVRRAFALNMSITAGFMGLVGATTFAGDTAQAAAAARCAMALGLLIGPTTFHFACTLTGWRRDTRGFRTAAFTLAFVLFAPTLSSSWMIASGRRTAWGFAGDAGLLAPAALFLAFVCALATFVVLVGRIRQAADSSEARRIRMVVVAYAAAALIYLDLLPIFQLDLQPTSFLWITAAAGILTYAIGEHGLLDAPDFGWRTLAWITASGIPIAPVVFVLWSSGDWMTWGRPLETTLVLFALFVLVRQHLEQVQPRIDDLFLHRRRDLRRELTALADKLAFHHTAEAIAGEVARVLERSLYVKLVALGVRDSDGVSGRWRVVHSAWGSVPPPDDDDALVTRLRKGLDPVLRHTASDAEPVLARYGAEAVVALSFGGDGRPRAPQGSRPQTGLFGLIAVGPRRDGRPFETYELAFLQRLRAVVAGPLVATRLFDRRHQLRLELEDKVRARSLDLARTLKHLESTQTQLVQREKMATLGLVVSGIAAELESAVDRASENVDVIAASVREYDDAAGLALAALPDGGKGASVRSWANEVRLDFVRKDVHAVVEAIAEGARRARGIAGDLRRFARVGPAPREPVDLHRELDATLNLLRHDLKGRIRVSTDYDPNLPILMCDRGPMGQVFMNLILNAAQAIEGPGTIQIRTRVLAEARSVEVAVRDDGKGIPPEHIGRIFEPFFTTKAFGQKGGTGLGLSISYGIVERHGGKIHVESELGRGAEFRIVIPVATSP